MSDIIAAQREAVLSDYLSASNANKLKFLKKDDKATSEYIYDNQKVDATFITDEFYKNDRRVISVVKKTKVGADGLMIEIGKIMCTHSDDRFVVDVDNFRIITGMSNVSWEKDMKEKAPACFKDRIFHHGKLKKADLKNMKNSLIIIDEIDTGDKEGQRLDEELKASGVLDVNHMRENNNRFVFISATMIKELYELYRWGDLHYAYKMTIPEAYIGHIEFLNMGIVKEFYDLSEISEARRWVKEDIIDNYGADYRVHVVRVKPKSVETVRTACSSMGVDFRNHTSADRLTDDEIKEFFKDPLPRHIVLGVKGFFRRANLIPNAWKLRIGATHELCTNVVDNNVQIQGLPGRMTGYWKDDILRGHKTGPHRTSVNAIKEYEKVYNDPFGCNSFRTATFRKKKGKATHLEDGMLDPKNIRNIVAVELPVVVDTTDPKTVPKVFAVTAEEYDSIKKIRGTWDTESGFAVLRKYDSELVMELERMRTASEYAQDNFVQPSPDATLYEMAITNSVNSQASNTNHWHDGNSRAHKSIDKYGIYLDSVEKRIVVLTYYGTKIEDSDDE